MGRLISRRPLLAWGGAFAAAGLLGACERTPESKFRLYDGPEVTGITVHKSSRAMHLWHDDRALESYRVDLGWEPMGHKRFEGDGRTPEGRYHIDRRNPESAFHLSLGISYPNEEDIEYALRSGKEPGGDIFIHGQPNLLGRFGRRDDPDWTAGCIALPNPEMELVYAMVRTGTPIDIYP